MNAAILLIPFVLIRYGLMGLLGGLKRTSERLGENLSGLTGKSRLDDDDLGQALLPNQVGL